MEKTIDQLIEELKIGIIIEKIESGAITIDGLASDDKRILFNHFNELAASVIEDEEVREKWEHLLVETIDSEKRIPILALKTAVEIATNRPKDQETYIQEAQEKYIKKGDESRLFDEDMCKKMKVKLQDLKKINENFYAYSIATFKEDTKNVLDVLIGQMDLELSK